MTGWNTVHVRINDTATGQPVPVRVRFEAHGQFLAPLGRSVEFPVESGVDAGGHVEIVGKKWHYIDGTCEILLPVGEVVVEVARGLEYQVARHVVHLAQGQISLRLTTQRWIDLRNEGWYSSDTRVLDLSPHAALLEGAAEDVAVVNLLAHQEAAPAGPVSNLLAFSGQIPALQREGHFVAVNSLNQHAELGTLGLLNCHRVVYPLRAGDEGLDEWMLADWCDQCHRKNTGLVIWSDPGKSVTSDPLAGEPLADLILGKVDAFEILAGDPSQIHRRLDLWTDLLRVGLRLALVAGSGKDSARQAIGQGRTYARIATGNPLGLREWVEAVRAGHTFITTGPLLRLQAAGQPPGAILRVDSGATILLRLESAGVKRDSLVEITFNGTRLAASSHREDEKPFVQEQELIARSSGWIVARCGTEGDSSFACTSPVYVEVPGRPVQPDATVLQRLIGSLDRLLAWTRNPPRRSPSARPERLAAVVTEAREVLSRRMSQE